MLYMKQIYYHKLAQIGDANANMQLKLTIIEINEWFNEEAESIFLHINLQEIGESEEINLYHHEIHKKKITKSAILELESEKGLLTGIKNALIILIKM